MTAPLDHHAHPAPLRFSLLRLSAGTRLTGAAALSAALWLGVLWALA